jgi:anaerobic selenocysteine-containing dehydrogenase
VRNVAKYSPATFERSADTRHDWEICLSLWRRIGLPNRLGPGAKLIEKLASALGPEAVIDAGLRAGPYGMFRGGLSIAKLRKNPHGIDLGALEPRLPARLNTPDKRVHVAPAIYLADLARLEKRMGRAPNGLVLIGRRHLRSNNSWMHNSERLVKGPDRCTVMMHPDDAAARSLTDGAVARISTKTGAIELSVEVTDSVMRGVVSVPHGWGHNRKGSRIRVAESVPGASVNDIVDPALIDELSGTSALTGQPVEVRAK